MTSGRRFLRGQPGNDGVTVDRYRRQGQNCPIAVLMSDIDCTTPGARAVMAELMAK